MANLITTDDLKSYALWLSGEPTDGLSDYDERVLQHMQTVYNTLINGGTLGTRDVGQAAGLYEHLVDIPTTDWMWLRKFPPFAFNTQVAFTGSGAGLQYPSGGAPASLNTVSLTNGSTAIVFGAAPATSVQGFRLKLLQQGAGIGFPPITVPRIAAHIAGSVNATLDAAWPQDTQSVSSFVVFKAEYDMPADFLRFCESPAVQGGWTGGNPPRLAIGSSQQVQDEFPIQELNQGPPTAAARISTTILQLNRWDTQSYRIEFSYVFQPDALTTGLIPQQQPAVPLRFRQILSIGAAMMVMQDKVDSRVGPLSSEFREILFHMGNEYRHEQKVGSEWAGRHLTRQGQRRRSMLRTTSGLPLF